MPIPLSGIGSLGPTVFLRNTIRAWLVSLALKRAFTRTLRRPANGREPAF